MKGDMDKKRGWLIFFYSVPSKPVGNRMKVWRRLLKAGALQFKGAVYILPMSEEHYEFFQWLVSEVEAIGGEAAFSRVESVASMSDKEIIGLFDERKAVEYHDIAEELEGLETRLASIGKGAGPANLKVLSDEIVKLTRGLEEAGKTDFFSSAAGRNLLNRVAAIRTALVKTAPIPLSKGVTEIVRKKHADYHGKVWTTRKRPFVDRMASAWLIRRFIDGNAVFHFSDEKDLSLTGKAKVVFDAAGAEFTHIGNLCTFEVMVRAFGIKDKAVRKIAEIVHELDIKDEKYGNPETRGLGDILSGLRKSTDDDAELLEKGISIFEMLYMSKKV